MTQRRSGRPPRATGPAIDHDAVALLIQHGELVPQPLGPPLRVFPGVRELARRFGVNPSTISRLAKRRGLSFATETAPLRQTRANVAEPARVRRRRGRPPKGTPPLPWEQIERLLVEGETTRLANGTVVVVYPDLQEIADRYNVSLSTISRYSSTQRCRERRAEHHRALGAELPFRLTEAQAAGASAGEVSLTNDPDEDLIVARRIVVRNYRLAAEAGEVRANDPIVVREADRLGRDAHDRKHGGETETSFQAMLAVARERALAGRLRFEALPIEATGRVIDATSEEVLEGLSSTIPDAGDK